MSGKVTQHPTMRGKDDLLAAIRYARAALADQDHALVALGEAVRRGVMSSREGIVLFYEVTGDKS